MLTLKSYTGQDIFYHRFNEVYKIGIIEKEGEEPFRKYKIRILELTRENPLITPLKVGDELTCKEKDIF